MSVSQSSIAKQLGLSQRAVSLALKGQQGVSDATRQRVVVAAKEMGYRPHSFARATLQGRTDCLALVLNTDATLSMLPSRMLDGVQSAVEVTNRHLIVTALPDEKLTSEGFVPKILRELAADGLLINYNAAIPRRMIDLIEAFDIPSVWLNSKQSHNCVHPDDHQGARLATQRLLQLGHRRIAYVDYGNMPDDPTCHYSGRDRWAGYAETLRDAGLTPRRIGDSQTARNGEMPADLRAALAVPAQERPTALLCYSSRDSRAAYHLAGVLGLETPRDLSIIRFGSPPYDDFGVNFTVAVIPEFEVGWQATQMLHAKLRQPGREQPTVAVPFSLHQGATVASPPEITHSQSNF